MKEFIISKKYENKDIYSVIKKQFPHLSISSLNKAFRIKDIKVNNVRINKNYILKLNDVVKIYITDNILFGMSNKIQYLYEDDNILVAYKPKGIQSNFEGNILNKDSLNLYFDELVKKDKGNNNIICHRLDTNTEGLMLFAKNEYSYKELLNAFKEHKIIKEYITLVYGKMPKEQDILSHYILKDEHTGYSKILNKFTKNAKSCITEYTVIKYIKEKNCSIVNVRLHTGRTHQIRAHMKYLGCPIIGDSKYCKNEINDKFKVYSQTLFATKYTFNFSNDSILHYLNNITIDITLDSINNIQTLLKRQ